MANDKGSDFHKNLKNDIRNQLDTKLVRILGVFGPGAGRTIPSPPPCQDAFF